MSSRNDRRVYMTTGGVGKAAGEYPCGALSFGVRRRERPSIRSSPAPLLRSVLAHGDVINSLEL